MGGDYDWVLKPVPSTEAVHALGRSLNDLPEPLARALVVRGVQTFAEAKSFFRGGLSSLHDPASMADMAAATERVVQAIRSKERVVVYGDYDVDGTTSTAMVTHFLRDRGVPATYFIPDRFKHGYGLCRTGIEEVAELGGSLIIALDCGVTATEEAEQARSLGIDLVICDHHTPPTVLPDAVAVLDPKRADCAYPFKELCGCGVAFKLLTSVATALQEKPESIEPYLDLVALATAADVVPLKGENRVLLREGLKRLRESPRLGIQRLAEEANVRLAECDTRGIQFGLAPRINAAGRLGDAKRAVKLFLTDDRHEATARARQLERVNAERRALDQAVLEEAQKRAQKLMDESDPAAIVLYDPNWHLGVVGIVAARLAERLNRPAILLGSVNGLAKGSARSIEGINIYNALTACTDLLQTFGGHDYAAGLALEPEHLAAFQTRFERAVADATSIESFRRRLEVDAELRVSGIDDRFWAVLEQFGPFGEENSRPVFVARGVSVAGVPRLAGRDQDHLKFRVRDSESSAMEVIGFRLGEKFDLVSEAVKQRGVLDIAFSLAENNWNGVRSLQIQAKDIRLVGA